MHGKCIGYLPNGNVCRRPATRLDPESGGMLCEDCWRAKQHEQVKALFLSAGWPDDMASEGARKAEDVADAQGITASRAAETIIAAARGEGERQKGRRAT